MTYLERAYLIAAVWLAAAAVFAWVMKRQERAQ